MTLERSLYSLSRARLAALTLITLTFSTRNDEMKKLRVQNVKEREIESRKKRVRQEIKEEDAGSKKNDVRRSPSVRQKSMMKREHFYPSPISGTMPHLDRESRVSILTIDSDQMGSM
jgi:hypothetical protein